MFISSDGNPLEWLGELPLAGMGMLLPQLPLRGRGAGIFELCLKSYLGQGSSILPAAHLWKKQGLFPQENSLLQMDTRAAAVGVVATSPK